MSQLFVSGGQSIGVSASTSVRPVNTQDWSPLGCTASVTSIIVHENPKHQSPLKIDPSPDPGAAK